MYGCKKPPRSDRPSIAYRQNQVKRETSDIIDFVLKGHASPQSKKKQQTGVNTERKSPEILNTTELISAVGQIWDLVNPIVISESEEKSSHNRSGSEETVVLDGLVVNDVVATDLKDGDCGYFSVDVRTGSHTTASIQPKFEFVKVTQKIINIEPHSVNYTRPLFSQFMRGSTTLTNEFQKGKGFASVEIFYKFERIYGWMNEIIPARSNYHNATKIEGKTEKGCTSGRTISHMDGCFSGHATHPGSNNALRSADCYSCAVKSKDDLLDDITKLETKTGRVSSLCSDYFLLPTCDNNVNGSVSRALTSSHQMDCHIDFLAPHKLTSKTFQHNSDDCKDAESENSRKSHQKFVFEDKCVIDNQSSPCVQPRHAQHALAKQEHAYAGAFAGIFASVCLHPVDTIKTVAQSHHAQQKSICNIGRSIVSERGVTGLYRGIASNLASSAPISAIYTFTYESVKGSLLPHFSKEYHSLAHCIAGGSASVATSFVFTPSECIKQQMQIGSRYHNCWNALIGIIAKGGLPSLYAGWGAVLCRNVPHSVIKFYTYESLKQLMISSQNSNSQPNTFQTLVCGGLAGSTAALFSTPFDVVKTRLQIQIAGTTSQYDGVFHALKEISKNEGLKGLYRGLIPRLVMYVSHGALFFASYEFFKRFFTLEVSKFKAQSVQYKESMEKDSTHLQWPS